MFSTPWLHRHSRWPSKTSSMCVFWMFLAVLCHTNHTTQHLMRLRCIALSFSSFLEILHECQTAAAKNHGQHHGGSWHWTLRGSMAVASPGPSPSNWNSGLSFCRAPKESPCCMPCSARAPMAVWTSEAGGTNLTRLVIKDTRVVIWIDIQISFAINGEMYYVPI